MSIWTPEAERERIEKIRAKRKIKTALLNAEGYCGCCRGEALKAYNDKDDPMGPLCLPDFGCMLCAEGRVPVVAGTLIDLFREEVVYINNLRSTLLVLIHDVDMARARVDNQAVDTAEAALRAAVAAIPSRSV